MTESEAWKLMGLLVTILIFMGGSTIVAVRSLRKQLETGDDQLHERINRVRDEYVRRVDLDNHMTRLEGTLKEMRDEQRAFAKDMMSLITRHD